ncbi:hypothetical protein RHGRI_015519 [Rhododendron griersonianum]|uniref:NB-ARC domain-containing protein n=1 Tax=Rhododendron griersonianum TaxID=479676 RepID=A0AAV6KE79_9ERIC|nr:hypothetical protein RHGRI_015519 [Rhododendron griersonianum]
MCSPTIVLDKIVEKIVDIVFESVGRHLGYLFNYKQNMKNLEVERDKLQELRRTFEGKIDEAENRGEVIVENVSDWRNGAERLRQGVEAFMDEKRVKENAQCFKFKCPNFISRYRLSKEAEKKMGDVKSLIEKANFDTISSSAPPPPELQFPSIGEYVSFDSRASAFNMIMEALKDSKVNVIGVYGAGGVGKTTMVEKVGEQVKKDGLFDEVVMAVVSQDVNMTKIQEVLADRLSLKLEAKTEVGKANELWNRLNNGKRNLVILDDTWKKLNLKEIGIPITDGNKGCKVVLTSRNQRVFKDMDVHKDFPIEVLLEEEAWNLFKKKMGNSGESNDQLHDDIANAVCKECRGLPVAILAVATALKDKGMDDWTSSLDKLQKAMLNDIEGIDPNLFKSLKLSYDYLKSKDAKSCFLLCCLFPEDAQVPIEELARHCMARRLLCQEPTTLEKARVIVRSVVNTLKTSCLLLDGENDDFVKMHDIVRDVAISIAKEAEAFMVKHGVEEWPETGTYEKYSAISLRSETIHELPNELVCPELHTLMLECSNSTFQRDTKIPDRFFSGAEKLMVLELDSISMLPLPSSLGKLTELRMLCLINCKLGDIAILECLKNKLEVLRLRGSDIKALPPEVGELTHLRLLDLGDCKELNVIPNGVISKLKQLEELHFPRSFKNWEGTTGNEEISKVSLDELMSLTRLSTLVIHIPHHRLLPKDLGFQNLIRFIITVREQSPHQYRGNFIKRMVDDQRLSIKDYSVVVLRDIIDIDDDFNILERLLGKPKWSTERGGLYPSRSFTNLTQLLIWKCGLKYLFSPSCARGLLQLQSLKIWESEIMEAVIGNEGEKDDEIIANVMKFKYFNDLESHNKDIIWEDEQDGEAIELAFSKKKFEARKNWLRHFELGTYLDQKEKLINSDFVYKELILFSMADLQWSIPSITSGTYMPIIPMLVVNGSEGIGIGWSSNIPNYSLRDIVANVAFPALEELSISSVPNITEIWDKNLIPVESICLIRSLYVWNCEKLMNVIPAHMLFLLKTIKTLEVGCCEEMEVIVELEKREEETQVAFPALEELSINRMPNITEIWDKNLLPAESFCRLRSLEIWDCEKLMNVIPSHMLFLLKKIKTLEVSYCQEMEVIVELEKREEETQEATNKDVIIVQGCEKLRSLKVKNCEKLVNVVPSHMLPLLKNIETLEVWGCPKMEVIVVLGKREEETQEATTNKDMIIVFPELRSLKLRKLENLKGVCAYKSEDRLCFNVQVEFPSLEELSIISMPNITEIWDENLLQPESICLLRSSGVLGYEKLRSLTVEDCEKLMNVVPSHMHPLLKNIQTLKVSYCPEMEVIVVLEKREEETQEATNKDMIILFPKLWRLDLIKLKNLKGVCAHKSEDPLCFNVQVTLLEFIKTSQENPDPDEACTAGPDAAKGVPAAGNVVEGGGVWRESDGLLGVFVGLPALDLLGLLLGEDAADSGGVVDDGKGGGGATEGMGWIEGMCNNGCKW